MKGNLLTKSTVRPVLRGVFVTTFILGLLGCVGPGIKQSAIKSEDVMEFVDKNYDQFIVTFSGQKGSPTAMRFDPKNDDVNLTGDGWHPVESKAQAVDMIRELNIIYRPHSMFYRGPYLFEIQSAEDRQIGYLYSLLVELNIRQEGNSYRMGPVTEADLKDERKLYSIKGAGG